MKADSTRDAATMPQNLCAVSQVGLAAAPPRPANPSVMRSITMASKAMTRPESRLWPRAALRMEESTSQPISSNPPMMEAMMTMLKAAMVLWLMPTSICGMAVGTSTSQKRWRGVQPLIWPDSLMSLGTRSSPSSVLRTIGGTA